MKTKFKILTIFILIVINILAVKYVEAAIVQSRPGVAALVSTTADNFFLKIRDMEKPGGIFGLDATFSIQNNMYIETSASNNIDVHMIKNTEWGGAAMLSASSYGAGNGKVTSTYNSTTKLYNVTASTTGNMSGVFGMNSGLAQMEKTSAGIPNGMSTYYARYIKNAKSRYIDKYQLQDFSKYIPGDATYEVNTFIKSGIGRMYGNLVIRGMGGSGGSIFGTSSGCIGGCTDLVAGARSWL